MVGAVAQNLHTGSRSEILADYLFSTWGTVTPTRRQDDYGIDLHCTLTKQVGQRAVVTDYYSVQVKSSDDPWRFEKTDDIGWLLQYPTPLFQACVDKKGGTLSVYQTMPRFLSGLHPAPEQLELVPKSQEDGACAMWPEGGRSFSLSAPILRVTLENLLDEDRLASLSAVMRFWVKLDGFNCDLRRNGLLRFRMPARYKVNEVPADSGWVAQWANQPDQQQLSCAVRVLH